jgi:hypothetical protein
MSLNPSDPWLTGTQFTAATGTPNEAAMATGPEFDPSTKRAQAIMKTSIQAVVSSDRA